MRRSTVTLLLAFGVLVAACQSGETTAIPVTAEPATGFATEISWTQHSLPDDFAVHALTAVGGRIFGLALPNIEAPDARTRLWVTDDGASSWEAIDIDATEFGMRAGYFREIAQVGNRYVAIVKGEPIDSDLVDIWLVVSDDAVVWERVDTGGGIPIGIAGGDSGAIAVVGFDDPDARYRYEVLHSADGVDWTSGTSSEFEKMGPFQPIEVFENRFYIMALVDGQPARLVTSADSSEWRSWSAPPLDQIYVLDPGSGAGGLVLLTRDNRHWQTWLLDFTGTWVETTPPSFEPSLGHWASSNAVLSDPDGIVVAIVDTGRSGGPQDPAMYDPPTVWWTLDGDDWQAVAGSDAFGSEGTIGAATVLAGTIFVVYHTHPDRIHSLWTGDAFGWP